MYGREGGMIGGVGLGKGGRSPFRPRRGGSPVTGPDDGSGGNRVSGPLL